LPASAGCLRSSPSLVNQPSELVSLRARQPPRAKGALEHLNARGSATKAIAAVGSFSATARLESHALQPAGQDRLRQRAASLAALGSGRAISWRLAGLSSAGRAALFRKAKAIGFKIQFKPGSLTRMPQRLPTSNPSALCHACLFLHCLLKRSCCDRCLGQASWGSCCAATCFFKLPGHGRDVDRGDAFFVLLAAGRVCIPRFSKPFQIATATAAYADPIPQA